MWRVRGRPTVHYLKWVTSRAHPKFWLIRAVQRQHTIRWSSLNQIRYNAGRDDCESFIFGLGTTLSVKKEEALPSANNVTNMADDVHCIFHHFDLCLLWIVSAIYILLRESFMVNFGAHTPQPLEPQAVRQWPTNRPTTDIYLINFFFKKEAACVSEFDLLGRELMCCFA